MKLSEIQARQLVPLIDDLKIYDTINECNWPEHAQEFPVLAFDRSENFWMAVLERPARHQFVRVCRIEGGERWGVRTLEPENPTGIGAPAIAGVPNGCVIALAVE